jgi:hypothetical protein
MCVTLRRVTSLLVAVVALGAFACRRAPQGAAACNRFSGSPARAEWSECLGGETRVLRCQKGGGIVPGAFRMQMVRPSGEGLPFTCDCLKDGAKEWSFSAEELPPLANRGDAERVYAAQCRGQ